MGAVSAASDETELLLLHMEALELKVNHEKSHLTLHRLCSSDKRQSSLNYEGSHGNASGHTLLIYRFSGGDVGSRNPSDKTRNA